MVFGIDLGTTNSLIGVGENLLTDLVSSSVSLKTKQQVGRDVVEGEVIASYKTDMSMGPAGEVPIKCSSIILRTLAQMATERTGEIVSDVVISVPAYFSTSQREAVYAAAKDAGLNAVCLINEPTAAALYTCRTLSDVVVVYDLGGGTFDVSIVDTRTGRYEVRATDGIVLGGDDLDLALCKVVETEAHIKIRYLDEMNRKILKKRMRAAKEEIQRKRCDVYVELGEFGISQPYLLTVDKYKEVVADVFGETIEMTQSIIGKNIVYGDTPKITFIGGSSNCPYLKEMLKEELELEEIPCDVNPDLIVAKGVALYADMVNKGTAFSIVSDVTKGVCIEDSLGKSIFLIEANTIVPCSGETTVRNSMTSSTLSLKIYQGDSIIAAHNDYAGTMVYEYGEEVEAGEGLVAVTAEVSIDGVITIKARDIYGLEEDEQIIHLRR